MPVAHIYAGGVLQDAMPLGAKVYGKFPKRLGQISAASGGESGGESDGRSDGRSGGGGSCAPNVTQRVHRGRARTCIVPVQ